MNELIVYNDGVPSLSPQIEQVLDEFMAFKTNFETAEKNFRTKLLETMQENGIYSANVGKYKLTCVSPKNKEIFNNDEFILNEADEIINLFTTFETIENFNVEKLKEKYPEIYKECCNEETIANVDVKKLQNQR